MYPMGLDNIPHQYPCVHAGTSIEREGRIDCTATIDAGQCPWSTHVERDRPGQPVVGMLGTHCWWRGAVSSYHLRLLATEGYVPPGDIRDGFYGSSGTGRLDQHYCILLADWLASHSEAFARIAEQEESSTNISHRELIDEYRYSVWWLRFVARYANGSDAWW